MRRTLDKTCVAASNDNSAIKKEIIIRSYYTFLNSPIGPRPLIEEEVNNFVPTKLLPSFHTNEDLKKKKKPRGQKPHALLHPPSISTFLELVELPINLSLSLSV